MYKYDFPGFGLNKDNILTVWRKHQNPNKKKVNILSTCSYSV